MVVVMNLNTLLPHVSNINLVQMSLNGDVRVCVLDAVASIWKIFR